jgi:hypothetical protein
VCSLVTECFCCQFLALLPAPLFGVARKSLQAVCSISPLFAASSGFNATRLSFLIRLQHNGDEVELPIGTMSIVNNTTVRLDYPEVPRYFHDSHLICYVKYGGRRIVNAEQLIQLEGEMPCFSFGGFIC